MSRKCIGSEPRSETISFRITSKEYEKACLKKDEAKEKDIGEYARQALFQRMDKEEDSNK